MDHSVQGMTTSFQCTPLFHHLTLIVLPVASTVQAHGTTSHLPSVQDAAFRIWYQTLDKMLFLVVHMWTISVTISISPLCASSDLLNTSKNQKHISHKWHRHSSFTLFHSLSLSWGVQGVHFYQVERHCLVPNCPTPHPLVMTNLSWVEPCWRSEAAGECSVRFCQSWLILLSQLWSSYLWTVLTVVT